jgi:glycosyltransferase involved in cell wall biosynthesis
MKIAVNARFLLPGKLEGLGWYAHEVTRRMAARHPNDTFLLLFDRPFDPRFVYGPNVQPVVVPPPTRHPLLWYAWFELALPLVFWRHRPDVFFSPDAYLSMRSPVRTLMTVHDLIPLHDPLSIRPSHRGYYLRNMPRFIRRADHLMTISEYTKRGMVEAGLASAEKITVAYNGCRDSFRPLDEATKMVVRARHADGQPYFFYTGAIHPRKNIPRLIRAFDQFKAATGAPTRLLLAGRFAWETAEVTAAWEQARHRDHIRLQGYVPEEDLTALMAAAEALVYVSLNEGFGLPVLEAMHCNTPVITSNTSALPEVAGEAALLVDPTSEADIVSALIKIYTDDGLVAGLQEKMAAQRQKFTWDAAAEQVYRQLERLVE